MTAGRAGYTLIEMMVAITILVIVVTVVFISMSSIVNTTEATRAMQAELRQRQFLQENLFAHFQSVYADAACIEDEYQFFGESDESAYGPADTVSFCTSLPMSGAASLPGVLKVVTYQVQDMESGWGGWEDLVPPEEIREGVMLTITEQPLIAALGEDSFGESMDYAGEESFATREVPLRSFDVQYYDGEAEEWVEEWDSMEQARLPWAVWIRADFQRSELEMEADLDRGIRFGETADLDLTIALPMGMGTVDQFIDLNHVGADTLMDPDGIFSESRGRSR